MLQACVAIRMTSASVGFQDPILIFFVFEPSTSGNTMGTSRAVDCTSVASADSVGLQRFAERNGVELFLRGIVCVADVSTVGASREVTPRRQACGVLPSGTPLHSQPQCIGYAVPSLPSLHSLRSLPLTHSPSLSPPSPLSRTW